MSVKARSDLVPGTVPSIRDIKGNTEVVMMAGEIMSKIPISKWRAEFHLSLYLDITHKDPNAWHF